VERDNVIGSYEDGTTIELFNPQTISVVSPGHGERTLRSMCLQEVLYDICDLVNLPAILRVEPRVGSPLVVPLDGESEVWEEPIIIEFEVVAVYV
jgi:hypothetical protein